MGESLSKNPRHYSNGEGDTLGSAHCKEEQKEKGSLVTPNQFCLSLK